MLKLIILFLLSTATLVNASVTKTILECSEKFSSLAITQNGNYYEINRSIRTNRVKGNAYVNGVVSTESSGTLEAKLLSSNSNSLTFQLKNGHFLKFSLTPTSDNYLEINMSSNENDLINDLNEIFKVSENPIIFYRLDACTIKN